MSVYTRILRIWSLLLMYMTVSVRNVSICCIVYICAYLYVLYVFERMYVYVSIVCICKYMYIYVSICMYIFRCKYCTYMIVYVCISQRHKYEYMQKRAYTYNTNTYVRTYRICTMCKCTYWIVFLVEYVTHF